MIRFENVCKSYSSGQLALDHVNFHLKKGEMAFLTGHSGAGKTTLLKLILAVEQPDSGNIFLSTQEISRLKPTDIPALRRSIGMIFQNPHLLQKRSVFENIALPLVIEGFRPHEINRRVHSALEKVGLKKKEKLFPAQLSSGEQQRVGIARAVVMNPVLMIADEPTGNLDPQLAQEIMNLFVQFNDAGCTVLVASHDLNLVKKLHHRVLHLQNGKLLSEGSHE